MEVSMALIAQLLPQSSGLGYISYSPAARQFGTKSTLDAISQIAADYFRNQLIQIQIGDMSFKTGAPMSPHTTHKDGKCIDVRPIRKDRKSLPIDISQSQYDHA